MFAASLLTMTAGRRFCISPPTEGSKFTHQTSPRFIGYVPDKCLDPFQRLSFSRFISGHFRVARREIRRHHVRTNEIFDELADSTRTDHPVQPVVHVLVNADRELLLHISTPFVSVY